MANDWKKEDGPQESLAEIKKQLGDGWEEEKSTVSDADRTAAREVVSKLLKAGNAGSLWWETVPAEKSQPRQGGKVVDSEAVRARATQLLKARSEAYESLLKSKGSSDQKYLRTVLR